MAASVLSLTVGFWMTSPSGVLASTPANQTVTNLADTAATIVWDTPSAETGTVNYGTSCGALTLSGSSNTNPHAVDLSGLTSGTTYFYNIVSGGTTYNNGGACYSFKTLPSGGPPPPPLVAIGHVYADKSCTTLETSGIVTAADSTAGSQPNESAINDTASGVPGTYRVAFYPAANSTSTGWFSPATGDTITVTADIGSARASVTATWDGKSQTITMPNICLPPVNNPTVINAVTGWNMVGGSPVTIWSDSTVQWAWNAFTGQWFHPTAASTPGTGVWEEVSTTAARAVNTQSCTAAVSVQVVAHRWNLIGNPCSASVTLPTSARAYWWDPSANRYFVVNTINPGAAAWVFPSANPLTLTPG